MTMTDEGTQGAVEQLRLRERLAKLRELPLLRGVGVSGECVSKLGSTSAVAML